MHAALTELSGQSHLGITRTASEDPASGVAKALTNVVTPFSAACGKVGIAKSQFYRFSGPAEFSPCATIHFRVQDCLIGVPFFVPQTQPGEVENFMDEDPRQPPRSAEQLRLKDDLAAAQKGRSVDRCSLTGAG